MVNPSFECMDNIRSIITWQNPPICNRELKMLAIYIVDEKIMIFFCFQFIDLPQLLTLRIISFSNKRKNDTFCNFDAMNQNGFCKTALGFAGPAKNK